MKQRLRAAWGWIRQHPYTAAIVLAGAVAGAVLAVVLELGPDDMSTAARAAGGALAGAWLMMFGVGFRLYD